MTDSDRVLDAIDGALSDFNVSEDAMRWTTKPGKVDRERQRWYCPYCDDGMHPKFKRSHMWICLWREHMQRLGLWR
jgi:hypothetical protein